MTPTEGPAVLRIRRPSGAPDTFLAVHAEIADGLIHATGRWERYPDDAADAYVWPVAELIELRWTHEENAGGAR